MVHALKEAWRVLMPAGIMIDVRPLSVDVPLEVVFNGFSESVGIVDLSPDLEYDVAADKAIDAVVTEGIFINSSMDVFTYSYYWKTYHAMVVDFKERWEGEINVPKEVLKKVREVYIQHRPAARLRMPMQMKLGKYIKQGHIG